MSVLQTVSTPVYDVACFLHPIVSNEFLPTVLEELNYLFILLEKITVQNYCPLEGRLKNSTKLLEKCYWPVNLKKFWIFVVFVTFVNIQKCSLL